jgi:Tol biopolymer transport system component
MGTFDGRAGEIWIVDLIRGARTRFSSGEWDEFHPVWHPSGQAIAFRSNRLKNILIKPADGTGEAAPLAGFQVDGTPQDWSPDGSILLYGVLDPSRGSSDLRYLKKGQSGAYEAAPFLQTSTGETQGSFSPDGRFLAYVSGQSGRPEVYVTSFPDGGGTYPVSVSGGIMPRWRKDGRELFYVAPDGMFMAVPVNIQTNVVSTGSPKALFPAFDLAYRVGWPRGYDVSADGNRFLVPESSDSAAKIRVVRNWFAEFRDRREE